MLYSGRARPLQAQAKSFRGSEIEGRVEAAQQKLQATQEELVEASAEVFNFKTRLQILVDRHTGLNDRERVHSLTSTLANASRTQSALSSTQDPCQAVPVLE